MLLDRMEKDGLIKKVKDLKSKNQIRVTLTEKGENAYRKCMPPDSIQNIFSALSNKQKEQLGESLDGLRAKALKELHVDYMETFTGFKGNNLPHPTPK
jgi:DNA-binding MarR family transcriptional regulator